MEEFTILRRNMGALFRPSLCTTSPWRQVSMVLYFHEAVALLFHGFLVVATLRQQVSKACLDEVCTLNAFGGADTFVDRHYGDD
jgi:hypothetical protein